MNRTVVDVPSAVHDRLVSQAQRFDAATFVYLISLMEEVRRAVKTSNASRALVDAAVVRMALAAKFSDVETLIARLEDGSSDDRASPAADSQPPQKSAAPAGSKPKAARSGTSTQRPRESSPAGRRRPASAAPSAAATKLDSHQEVSSRSHVSSADEDLARSDPNIRKAMELFDGTLVAVQRLAPPAGDDVPPAAGNDADTNAG